MAVAVSDPLPADDEDDWFGEGSAFDSGEDLAAALLAIAATARAPVMVAEPAPAGRAAAARPAPVAQTLTWTVRRPGSVSIPMRQPGRTGWSIRSSVQVLHRTEEVMRHLREEAVVATFHHAARAVRLAELSD